MAFPQIYSCTQLMDFIQEAGFLPLLDGGFAGFSAEEIVDENCHYVTYPDGGWDWPLLNTPEALYGRGFIKWRKQRVGIADFPFKNKIIRLLNCL